MALDDVSLEIRPGEIHGLLGENGSGKSTLIKVLAGFHDPDTGTLSINGQDVPLPLGPGRFQDLGFAFVHQDLGLIPSLTVLENLRLPYFASAHRPWLQWQQLHRDARTVLQSYGIPINTRARVGNLAPVERSMLAIVRAIESLGAGTSTLLVLDEPTVYLPQREVETLFRLVHQVAQGGTGVLFVSHDLDEVLEICDRITVLRDGRLVDTVDAHDLTKSSLVRLIIGREHTPAPVRVAEPEAARLARPLAAKVERVSGDVLNDVSFTVESGEIVGATGLAGSGFQELPYVLYGAPPHGVGSLVLGDGRTVDLARLRPNQAVDAGVILVPGNRQVDGCVQTLSVSENISVPTIARFFKGARLRHRAERSATRDLLHRFGVRPPEPNLRVGNLSGGNQQKVLLAKWLQISPRLLLFDEPTQGVDVGAREEIFAILRGETDRGAGVICASSDHEQLATICDRVLVFARGRIVKELRGEDITKEEITLQCLMSIPM